MGGGRRRRKNKRKRESSPQELFPASKVGHANVRRGVWYFVDNRCPDLLETLPLFYDLEGKIKDYCGIRSSCSIKDDVVYLFIRGKILQKSTLRGWLKAMIFQKNLKGVVKPLCPDHLVNGQFGYCIIKCEDDIRKVEKLKKVDKRTQELSVFGRDYFSDTEGFASLVDHIFRLDDERRRDDLGEGKSIEDICKEVIDQMCEQIVSISLNERVLVDTSQVERMQIDISDNDNFREIDVMMGSDNKKENKEGDIKEGDKESEERDKEVEKLKKALMDELEASLVPPELYVVPPTSPLNVVAEGESEASGASGESSKSPQSIDVEGIVGKDDADDVDSLASKQYSEIDKESSDGEVGSSSAFGSLVETDVEHEEILELVGGKDYVPSDSSEAEMSFAPLK